MSHKQNSIKLSFSIFYGVLHLVFIDHDSQAQQAAGPTSAEIEITALDVNSPRGDGRRTNAQGFTLKSSSATGITFTNHLNTDLSPKSFNLLNGSGVTLGDYDADGRCDVFLVAMSGKNKLFETSVIGSLKKPQVRQA